MFSSKPDRKSAAPIAAETVLSTEIKLEGHLRSTSNIRFGGEMVGDLSTEGDLSVDGHGKVKGNVTGRNVVVAGTIQGNVTTSGRLEILSTGRVHGDIVVGSLIIDEGGVFRGKSAVPAEESPSMAVKPYLSVA